MTTKRASEILVGDTMVEGGAGGMEWRVDRVAREGGFILLTINLTDADMMICRPTPNQVKRFRPATRIYVAK